MLLTLIRDTFTPAETLGKLLIDGKPFCDTLEPPSLMHCIGTECSANIKAMQASSSSQNKQVVSGTLKCNAQHPKGAIPQGWYKIQVTRSPKFGRLLPLLYYVPGFEGIRIHAGNNRDHTSGCILVGERAERYEPTLKSPTVSSANSQSKLEASEVRWNSMGADSGVDRSVLSDTEATLGPPCLYRSRRTEETLTQQLIKAQKQHEEIYINITDIDRYPIERTPLIRYNKE